MLVSVVPASLDHFPSVRLVLLDRRIGQKTDVVVDIEVEQRTRLATGLVDDEVVECVVLKLAVSSKSAVDAFDDAYMRNDQVLLDWSSISVTMS